MVGTVAMTSRDSEVTIGVIMKARMMPAVKNDAPLVGGPNMLGRSPASNRVFQPSRGRRCRDLVQVGLGGRQQRLAPAGPLGGQERVAAADQPLAGAVGVADLSEVVHIGQ